MPNSAGKPCTLNIFIETVNAPYIPAITTQLRKNKAMFTAQKGSVTSKDQSKPAAKKPLYKPWLAAMDFVGSNKWSGKFLNTLLAWVVQTNISSQRK